MKHSFELFIELTEHIASIIASNKTQIISDSLKLYDSNFKMSHYFKQHDNHFFNGTILNELYNNDINYLSNEELLLSTFAYASDSIIDLYHTMKDTFDITSILKISFHQLRHHVMKKQKTEVMVMPVQTMIPVKGAYCRITLPIIFVLRKKLMRRTQMMFKSGQYTSFFQKVTLYHHFTSFYHDLQTMCFDNFKILHHSLIK